MDFIKNIAASAQGGNHPATQDGRPAAQSSNVQATSAGVGGGLMGKLNGALGGGQSGEKNEDYLDKAVDFVQEKFMGAGDQSNESAFEQAKDEQISDAIRGAYKNATGKEFFIADKS